MEKELIKEMAQLEDLIKSQTNVKNLEFRQSKELLVKLDTKITKELEIEGYYREVSRKIQALRKKAGLKKEDEISLVIESKYDISKFESELKSRVGAVNLSFGKIDGALETNSEEKIKEKIFKIAFNKL
tara:strand:- start:137 stop:523 length:387 start_codon:yes stop_codon:yes gene_type:complete